MERAESFFLALQYAARDYIALSATKTRHRISIARQCANRHE